MSNLYERSVVSTIVERANESRKFIQVLVGPRQTGKTTALKQAIGRIELPTHFASADDTTVSKQNWLRTQWEYARSLISNKQPSALLIIDEIQNIPQWSMIVKQYWDEDAWQERDLRVIISGSAPLLLQSGLSESLMGRYEIIYNTHWTLQECQTAFGYSLEDYLLIGSYPGAASLCNNHGRWLDYMNNSIIEPTLQKDVIAMESVRKPALMRALLLLGLAYSGQELSYRKIQGQLDDAGNTTTLAHYLRLLENAGLLSGLQKYDPKPLKTKSSTPRLFAHNTGLMTAVSGSRAKQILTTPDLRGHLVETAIGAYLMSCAKLEHFELYWWREGNKEVDFVLVSGDRVVALEVKSGRAKNFAGQLAFKSLYPQARLLLIGDANNSVEDFLLGKVELF